MCWINESNPEEAVGEASAVMEGPADANEALPSVGAAIAEEEETLPFVNGVDTPAAAADAGSMEEEEEA